MTPEAWTVIGALIAGLVGGGGVGALLVKYKMQQSAEESASALQNLRQEFDADREGVQVLISQIKELNDQVRWLREENRKLTAMHLDTVNKLSETLIAVGYKTATIKALEAEREALKRQIDELQAQADRKDRRIAELEKQVGENRKEMAALYAKVISLEKGSAGNC